MGTITKDFSYREFEASATADRKDICNVIRTFEVRDAVKELTLTILQPLRDAWGGGIRITSGWRCEELNNAVLGSKTSAHLTGYAADIQPSDGRIGEFMDFAESWLKRTGVPFDQCIRETDNRGARWLHIGLKGPDGCQRGQFLTLKKNTPQIG